LAGAAGAAAGSASSDAGTGAQANLGSQDGSVTTSTPAVNPGDDDAGDPSLDGTEDEPPADRGCSAARAADEPPGSGLMAFAMALAFLAVRRVKRD
jgi:MYXO-CTERM domain-containing protein